MARLTRHVDTAIARRSAGEDRPDVLAAMLRRPTQRGMAPAMLREEAIVLSGTAASTVTRALTFLIGELARSAPARGAVAAEVDATLHGARPRAEHLRRLVIADRSYAEAIRLHPPVWHVMRRASVSTTLPSGVVIEPAAKVMISPWLLHHDPLIWPEPERFDPDRFLPAMTAVRPKLAYLPFGSGPRICPGRALAALTTKLALAWTAQRWDWTPAPGAELRTVLRPDGLFPADGLRVVLQAR